MPQNPGFSALHPTPLKKKKIYFSKFVPGSFITKVSKDGGGHRPE